MTKLVKRLSGINVHPYHEYMHDMVKGVEEMRTSIQTSIDIEKDVRGSTAGFNTPLFICGAPGGCKCDLHSFDYYDREIRIAVYSAPSVKAGQSLLYFDPLDMLSPEAQRALGRPGDPGTHDSRRRRQGPRQSGSAGVAIPTNQR